MRVSVCARTSSVFPTLFAGTGECSSLRACVPTPPSRQMVSVGERREPPGAVVIVAPSPLDDEDAEDAGLLASAPTALAARATSTATATQASPVPFPWKIVLLVLSIIATQGIALSAPLVFLPTMCKTRFHYDDDNVGESLTLYSPALCCSCVIVCLTVSVIACVCASASVCVSACDAVGTQGSPSALSALPSASAASCRHRSSVTSPTGTGGRASCCLAC
jgi:hypothetical protein